jgi:hypothetical protein
VSDLRRVAAAAIDLPDMFLQKLTRRDVIVGCHVAMTLTDSPVIPEQYARVRDSIRGCPGDPDLAIAEIDASVTRGQNLTWIDAMNGQPVATFFRKPSSRFSFRKTTFVVRVVRP